MEFYSATCYDIGGDLSLDGEGTINKLGKINRIPACVFHACVLAASYLCIVSICRKGD